MRGAIAVSLLALAVSACGGGGGGGVGSTPTPIPAPTPTPTPAPTPTPTPPPPGYVITPRAQQPTRSSQDDTEFRRNYTAFEYVNALYALDNGWTGQGVKVAVIDDGVKSVSELSGKISSLSRDYGTLTQGGVTRDRNVIGDDEADHGTAVATVIAGLNNGSGIQGIAPGAEIVALRISEINLDTTVEDDRETLGIGLEEAVTYAGALGIKVINASFAKVDAEVADAAWTRMIAGYAATGGLFVNSAGNETGANADGYLDLDASNRDGWLFVVALDDNETSYQLASYSNQCGTRAMDRCVGAMGTNAAQAVDGSLVFFGGTSSAAPQVSGLAALILSKWPQLSGVQAGQVILNTARDIGAAGVDPVFGHGLIDVRAALSPVNPTLSNGAAQTSVAGTAMVLPGAVGASGFAAKALGSVTVLDAYGRDFSGDLSGLVVRPGADSRWLDRRVQVQANAGAASIATPQLRASAGFTSLRSGYRDAAGVEQLRTMLTSGEVAVRSGKAWLTASLNSTDAVADEFLGLAPSADAVFAYSPVANLAVGARYPLAGGVLGVETVGGRTDYGSARGAVVSWRTSGTTFKTGMIDEQGVVFGTPTGSGALRFGDGARTVFAEASQDLSLGRWHLSGYASLGATQLDMAGDMLLTHAGTMVTNRFGLTAGRALGGGRMTFGIAQPLTVISGEGTYTVGSGYDLASRSLLFTNRSVDFGGRIDPLVTFGFERGGEHSQLRVGLAANVGVSDVRALGTWRLTLP
ncbi:S8 family peptidase [Novosphingobium sp. AP12]|uniref:S8 family peptidase n=1 Tax=Novosphingobium sp. AP12 TaxID=1144305 RepID=UPI001EE68428|nr:S8 family peptidase [Novosphingobium sp. AP12]